MSLYGVACCRSEEDGKLLYVLDNALSTYVTEGGGVVSRRSYTQLLGLQGVRAQVQGGVTFNMTVFHAHLLKRSEFSPCDVLSWHLHRRVLPLRAG